MRVFFNAIFVQIFLSLYILWRGCQAVPNKIYLRIGLISFFLVEILLYFTGFLFSKHLSLEALHYVALTGTCWMVFVIYTSALLIPFDILRFFTKGKRLLGKVDISKPKIRSTYYWTVICLVVLVLAWGNYRFKNPIVKEINIEVANKKTSLDSLKIVVAADLHVGFLIQKDRLQQYVDLIMEQKPDLILLVGDMIDFDIKSVISQNMKEEFNQLKALYGVFMSTGNHEYIGLGDERAFEKVEWLVDSIHPVLLRDTVALVEDKFYVVGREDDMYKFRNGLDSIMMNVDTTMPVILLNHEPSNIHESADYDIDIAFYGHTHNGQIFPANILLKFLWELPYGYRQIENSHVYVTSGLGLAGPQFRIGTVSEIVVVNVKFKK